MCKENLNLGITNPTSVFKLSVVANNKEVARVTEGNKIIIEDGLHIEDYKMALRKSIEAYLNITTIGR